MSEKKNLPIITMNEKEISIANDHSFFRGIKLSPPPMQIRIAELVLRIERLEQALMILAKRIEIIEKIFESRKST